MLANGSTEWRATVLRVELQPGKRDVNGRCEGQLTTDSAVFRGRSRVRIHFSDPGTPNHHWSVVGCGCSYSRRKFMLYSPNALVTYAYIAAGHNEDEG